MAAAKICDACGEFFSYNNKTNHENGIITVHFDEKGAATKQIHSYELCPSCLEKVIQIVQDSEEE